MYLAMKISIYGNIYLLIRWCPFLYYVTTVGSLGKKRKISSLGVEKRVLLLDGNVPFHLIESQIRHASGIGSALMKLIYLIKCEIMSICVCILSQEDLTAILYLYDLYKVDRIYTYVEKESHQSLSTCQVEEKETCLSTWMLSMLANLGMIRI